MRTQRLPQRFLALLLAFVMCLACAPQALAEDSAKATTMQLQKTEGTVTISNASGKDVPTRDSLRLYNGYRLETEEASYAWINLDKSKLVKEDAVSEISIRKSGKKLDILVDSGNLFFNVSEPLEDDESLNIRTSTMVVGIRGTCGWVKVIDQWTCEVYILEGTVEVMVTDPVTGETKTGTIRGGETASCVVYPQDRPGSKCDILRQTYTEGDIDGFVLVELTPDAPLCEKVLKETGLNLRGPGVKPEERLKKDQAEVRENLKQIADQVQKQDHNVSTEPVWTSPASDSAKPSGSTGSTGSTGGGTAPAPTETITLTMPQTAATVNGYLSRGTVRQVNLVPGTRQTLSARASTATDLDVDTALTVPAGKILTLQSGVGLTAADGGLLTVRGTLTVDGDFRLSGDLGAGSQNGVIKAKAFKLAADVVSWKVPAATDSAGFYTLAYSPKGAYTVTFNANGGSVTPAPMKTGTDGKLTSLPTPTRTGFAFNGWYTALTGGELVDTSYVFKRDTTVYARWTENAAPVTGTAGTNITWTYSPSTKTLSFTGSGAMTGYGAATGADGATVTNTPWEQYRPEIQSVVIGSGITSIGGYAFTECPKLTDATIPGTVTDVSGYAFFGSGSLKDVYYDGTEAQWNTIAISSGNQPLLDATKHFTEEAGDPVTGTAGNLSWEYTPATRTLRIWGSGAMDNYALTTFPAVNTPWSDYQTEIEHVVVESGVTTIGDRAFYNCTALTDAQLPSGITRIGNSAFYNCAALTNAPIPNGVTTILQAAFSGCASITSVTIPDTVASLGHDAFGRCTALADVKLSNNLTVIDNSTFDHCTSLKEITIPNSVTELKNGAFLASGLTSLTLPAGLATIGPNVFSACTGLTDVYFNGTRAQWNAVTVSAINNDPLLNATIHCTDDGSYTITFNASGGTVTPASATTGTDGKLTTLPTPTRSGYTFNGWFTAATGGTQVTVSTVFTQDAAIYAQWTQDSTSGISGTSGDLIWEYNPETTTLTFRATGPNGRMENYPSPVGTSRPWTDYVEEITDVVLEEGVTSAGAYAFEGCTNLKNVVIPSTLTDISMGAVNKCTSLESINIPDTVTLIGVGAFTGCTSLTNIKLPKNVRMIETPSLFSECSSLTSITFPENITNIGNYMFSGCSNLASITIPSSVTSIGSYAFRWCPKLASISIPASVDSIGTSAFNGIASYAANIYYGGTEAQWNDITGIADAGIPDSATIHYNSTGPAARSVVNNAAPGYTDVPEDAWYAEAVAFCRENGLMNGTSATEFSPDATLTRAMMVTVLHRLAGKPAAAAPASFADVPAGQWYTEAVSWANAKGIVLGYDGVTFGVDDPVTHEQAGLIFQRYTGGNGVRIPGADAPQAPATRAEIASALMDCARSQAGFASRSAIDVMCAPSGIALDRDGSLLVTDVYGKRLWKVRSRSGTVYAGGETVQGLYGEPVGGYNDASLAASYFKEPWAVAPFLDGWAVSDTENGVVRLIQGGSARTLNGATKEQLKVTELGVAFDRPTGLAADDAGNLYVSDTGNGAVRKITPEGAVTTAAKDLAEPMGLCWKDGVLYIAEAGKNRVVTLAEGKVTVLAGSGEDGLKDGGAKQAAFSAPQGVAVGADGSVYVADTGNGAVRKIQNGAVTTLAAGDLMTPRGLLLQGGSLYVCDPFARKIFVFAL